MHFDVKMLLPIIIPVIRVANRKQSELVKVGNIILGLPNTIMIFAKQIENPLTVALCTGSMNQHK